MRTRCTLCLDEQFVDNEVSQRDRQRGNDDPIEALSRCLCRRGAGFDGAVTFEAFRRPLECPRQDEYRDETDRQSYDNDPRRGIADAEHREQGLDNLYDEPGKRKIRRRYADDIATPEFLKERHDLLMITGYGALLPFTSSDDARIVGTNHIH